MKALITLSFTLFSLLSVACGVEDPPGDDAADIELEEAPAVDLEDIEDVAQDGRYCDEHADCLSHACDLESFTCRVYPF